MIERQFVAQKLKEFQIQEYITETLGNVGHSHTKLQRTPLGEKIVVFSSRPGLVVGRKGANIKKLTTTLKKRFGLENPQIEISEVENINLDATIVAERIISSLEKFGTQRFKGVGHKSIQDVMNAGALGVEILISGKIPSSRAKTWRFYKGYLKKCGDVAVSHVKEAHSQALLKTGVVGVKVKIMLADTELPDKITWKEQAVEEKPKVEVKDETVVETKDDKKVADKKPSKKKDDKKDQPKAEKAPEKVETKKETVVEEVKTEKVAEPKEKEVATEVKTEEVKEAKE